MSPSAGFQTIIKATNPKIRVNNFPASGRVNMKYQPNSTLFLFTVCMQNRCDHTALILKLPRYFCLRARFWRRRKFDHGFTYITSFILSNFTACSTSPIPTHLSTMNLFFLLLSVQTIICIPIGTMSNVSCIPANSSAVIFNGSCQECLCHMFTSTSTAVAMINCYARQSWCELFNTYLSTTDILVANENSTLFFLPNKSWSVMTPISKLIKLTMMMTVLFSIGLYSTTNITSSSSTSSTGELISCGFLFSIQHKRYHFC